MGKGQAKLFLNAIIENMYDYIQVHLKKSPNNIIAHIGTKKYPSLKTLIEKALPNFYLPLKQIVLKLQFGSTSTCHNP